MKLSFPHTDLLIEHLAQETKVSSIVFDHCFFDFLVPLCVLRPERTVLPVVSNDVDLVRFASDVDGGMCAFLVHSSATFHPSEQPPSIAPTVQSNQAELHQDVGGNDTIGTNWHIDGFLPYFWHAGSSLSSQGSTEPS